LNNLRQLGLGHQMYLNDFRGRSVDYDSTAGLWIDRLMSYFSLNRHNQSINLNFMDGSGRSVAVEKLKTLRWSTHPDWPAP